MGGLVMDLRPGGHPQGVRPASARPLSSVPPDSAASRELAELFRSHFEFVWRVLRRLGLSDHEAEDGVQEVFLVVADKLSEYEERGALRAWLFTIARQVASHARRADQRRLHRHQRLDAPPPLPDPQQLAEQNEAVAIVEAFLSELDEGQALVFFLSEVEAMSAPEIAAALGLTLTTVYGRQRLSRKRFEAFVRQRIAGGPR
jgi:RNA polymerase sigma-70 factor (ECF subfamily)